MDYILYIFYKLDKFFIGYIILINLMSFCLFALDKKRASAKGWRISENSLLLISLLGGSLGGLIAMNFFRHKTKKLKFSLGLPLLLLLNLLSLIYLMNYMDKVGINNSPFLEFF